VFDGPLKDDEIILHGDLGPWNTVWLDDRLEGFIDWDLAHPGPAIEDLAQMAWYLVPLRPDDHAKACGLTDLVDRAGRLRALCSAYGGQNETDVLEAAASIMHRELRAIRNEGALGLEPWATFVRDDQETRVAASLNWLRPHAQDFA
jgi:Ser/Thr protein kinase RdoA (MazF antagonist)